MDAEEIMSAQSDTEQYVYGLEAGRILRKIHSIPAPANQEDWEIRFNRKMDYKIQKYLECPIKYEGGEAFIEYIVYSKYTTELLAFPPQNCYTIDCKKCKFCATAFVADWRIYVRFDYYRFRPRRA